MGGPSVIETLGWGGGRTFSVTETFGGGGGGTIPVIETSRAS